MLFVLATPPHVLGHLNMNIENEIGFHVSVTLQRKAVSYIPYVEINILYD